MKKAEIQKQLDEQTAESERLTDYVSDLIKSLKQARAEKRDIEGLYNSQGFVLLKAKEANDEQKKEIDGLWERLRDLDAQFCIKDDRAKEDHTAIATLTLDKQDLEDDIKNLREAIVNLCLAFNGAKK